MKLHELKNVPGAIHRKKRVGCGEGSGHGKTSGRGGKGQTARSGGSIRPGFEGGQMPLYRKLPHRGFNQAAFREEIAVVNVGDLARLADDVKEVDIAGLVAAGLIRAGIDTVKVLGDGEISRSLKVTATKFSESAKAKIEKAGGQAVVLAAS
ncbi:50S ribosomal protein L15 [Opitutaceae bacterium TAV4]|uniref:50S ribosomal protein L15 n=1 Tax=Geminisphaera colitermitum TaxID=1148786 RepID=UPI0005BAE57D|nr:50S ribosomal protein L15 [Geminisphaera colitermitum]RRJ96085.1 50S ribosomal protein L15 [Opitutaceae bacterium TAV4]RRK00222.1 50S ribosomal protein L15 [Opitutaceae bacterium TAV3]